MSTNFLMIVAALFSAGAALLHVGCIVYGAPWYRFFGAGEQMASLAERGSIVPTLITLGIVFGLALASLYAVSGSGLITYLPLLRETLVSVTAVYLLRGVLGFFLVFKPLGRPVAFWTWSSLVCLVIGTVHLAGLIQVWDYL